jgi:hypothetical protein
MIEDALDVVVELELAARLVARVIVTLGARIDAFCEWRGLRFDEKPGFRLDAPRGRRPDPGDRHGE